MKVLRKLRLFLRDLAPTERRCGLCVHWQLSNWSDAHRFECGGGYEGIDSKCRRYAPRDGWPTTNRTDICGEFRRDWRRRKAP